MSRFNGLGNDNDTAYSVAVSPDGSVVFVTGASIAAASGQDYVTLAYDAATGGQLWVSRYNGPGNDSDLATTVAVSPGGSSVFVTGVSVGVTSGQDFATVAYSARTGARLWVNRYNSPDNGNEWPYDLAVSPGGSKVFVTGYSSSATRQDFATVAYSATTGAQLWARRYDGPAHGATRRTAFP